MDSHQLEKLPAMLLSSQVLDPGLSAVVRVGSGGRSDMEIAVLIPWDEVEVLAGDGDAGPLLARLYALARAAWHARRQYAELPQQLRAAQSAAHDAAQEATWAERRRQLEAQQAERQAQLAIRLAALAKAKPG